MVFPPNCCRAFLALRFLPERLGAKRKRAGRLLAVGVVASVKPPDAQLAASSERSGLTAFVQTPKGLLDGKALSQTSRK
jgi:hypothetical protein